MKYRAICFDVDGTLYPVSEMNRYIAKFAFFHPSVTKKYSDTRIKFRENQDNFEACNLQNADFNTREAAMAMMACSGIHSIEEGKRFLAEKYYKPLLKYFGTIKPHDEVGQTIDRLRARGIIVGVLSDWPFGCKLDTLKLNNRLDFKYTPEEMKFLKPSVHCFEYLLYNLKMDASEVLYVGDSYNKDVLGAKSAGIDAVLINCNDSEAKEKYPEAVAVCKNWAEFDKWISAKEN